MVKFFRRFADDIRKRAYLDAYAVGFATLVIAALTVLGDNLPEDLRWAAALSGIGTLVIRLTMPENRPIPLKSISFGDRSAFDDKPLTERLKTVREVNIFAPSAANVLNEQYSQLLRKYVLSRRQGRVRIVVLDPTETCSIDLAVRQLDESLEYQRRDFRADLACVIEELHKMSQWRVDGKFDYRFLDYSPGFSMVALNPRATDGAVIVELHGFHNESTASRMHVEFTMENNPYWCSYWCDQFEHIWRKSRMPQPQGRTVSVEES